ncbi:Olfactory protein [Operophtera brumata]|uniref:Olfactory protein n=1 Tax=Operophtera brumata TaxID=104452 RepID=A0A0L7LE98_OPEBR|nr:Olfactory protein [Operophtera brumata]
MLNWFGGNIVTSQLRITNGTIDEQWCLRYGRLLQCVKVSDHNQMRNLDYFHCLHSDHNKWSSLYTRHHISLGACDYSSRGLHVLCCLTAAALADKYTDKYDNIDLKEILENKRLLLAYVACALDKGKCSPEGKELRDNLQEAIATGCEKCTETQEKGAYTVIEHLIKNEPEIWREITAKFDPEGKYRKKYEDRAKAKGIVIPDDLELISNVVKMFNELVHLLHITNVVVDCTLLAASVAAAERYTDRYDDINYDEILGNKRLLVPYLKCILDKGRCTAEGRELKGMQQETPCAVPQVYTRQGRCTAEGRELKGLQQETPCVVPQVDAALLRGGNSKVCNKRLLVPYLKCILDKGRCTAEGRELKGMQQETPCACKPHCRLFVVYLHIKDAMQSGCEQCTHKQREGARKVVTHIKADEKEYWGLIKAKYDPGDKFKDTYEAFLAAEE